MVQGPRKARKIHGMVEFKREVASTIPIGERRLYMQSISENQVRNQGGIILEFV